MTLNAQIELVSASGNRLVPIEAFVLGNRRTALRDDEMVAAIRLPERPEGARSLFLKLGTRRHLVISLSMVAITLDIDAASAITRAAVAVGACAATARRLAALEACLVGHKLGVELARLALPEHLAPLAPIDDIRATAAYRLDATLTLIRRGLAGMAGS